MQEDIKKSFLSKEKIGTMEKDLQRLREKTAEKERQEIIQRTEKEHTKNISQREKFGGVDGVELSQDIKKPLPATKQQRTGLELGKLLQKLSIRIVFIFIILAIIGGLIFLFLTKEPATITPKKETQKIQKQLIVPREIFETNYSSLINLESIEIINQKLESRIDSDFENFGFYRLLFKKNEFELFTDKEIFSALNIFPLEIAGLFDTANEGNFLFFVYNNGLNKRPGFIIKIKQEEQEKIKLEMKNWEKNIESSIMPLLLMINEPKDKYYTTNFKEISFLNEKIRFQTLSQNDYGICYATTNDYLILTTSIESVGKVISILINKN